VRARLAFQPLCEVTAAVQAGSHPAPNNCLVSLFVSPRTMLPGGCGPRRVAPVRRAGRSAVHLAAYPL